MNEIKPDNGLVADEKHPFGYCECAGCSVCGGFGPVAMLVERNGKDIRLCTKCDVPSDKNKRWLITRDTVMQPFVDWDALGAICAVGALSDA